MNLEQAALALWQQVCTAALLPDPSVTVQVVRPGFARVFFYAGGLPDPFHSIAGPVTPWTAVLQLETTRDIWIARFTS